MQDIHEFNDFLNWNLINFYSIIFILLCFTLFFVFRFFRKKSKKIEEKIEKKQEINFLEELEKIKNDPNFLQEWLGLFSLFLEEKWWIKNVSKMTLDEVWKLKLEKKYFDIFKEIYFLVYDKKEVSSDKKYEIYSILKEIFK